jgi:DNA-binding transcriptional LysR family regulator
MTHGISHQALRRLIYFAAIADAGSIRGAAGQMNLSVPVLSEALSELEAELGVTLAVRSTRRFALTDAGRQIQDRAAKIVSLAREVRTLSDPDKPLSGHLAMTLPVELASNWIAPYLATFRRQHPGVTLEVVAEDAVADLDKSRVDLAIRTSWNRGKPKGATSGTMLSLPLSCVTAHPPETTRAGDVIHLSGLPILAAHVDHELHGFDPATQRSVRIIGAERLFVDDRNVAIALARQGLGVALVVHGSVASDLATGTLQEALPGLDFGAIELNVVMRDALPSPAALAFRDLVLAGRAHRYPLTL